MLVITDLEDLYRQIAWSIDPLWCDCRIPFFFVIILQDLNLFF